MASHGSSGSLPDAARWKVDVAPRSLTSGSNALACGDKDICRAALKSRTCLKDDELLQINPGFRKLIMHLNPGLGTRQNEEEGADSGVNETVET
jgi:hypothetical protein